MEAKPLLILLAFAMFVTAVHAEALDLSLLTETGLNSSTSAAGFSPDGNYIVAGGFDGNVRVFNRTLDMVWEATADEPIRFASISSGGERVLFSTTSGLSLLEKGTSLWTLHPGFVSGSSLSGNGRGVAYAVGSTITYIDTHIKDPKKNQRTFTTKTPVESLAAHATSSYRTWNVAAGDQSSVYLFSRDGFQWSYPVDERVTAVAISLDGGYVAAGTRGGWLYLFDDKGGLLATSDLGRTIHSLSISNGAGFIAAATSAGMLVLSGDGEVVSTIPLDSTPGGGISSNGGTLALVQGKRAALYRVPHINPASLEIESPTEGETYSDEMDVTIRASRIRSLSIRLDGVEIAGRSFKLDTNLIGNGQHALSAEGTDFSGNPLRREVNFNVDNGANVPPALELLGIGDGDIVSGSRRLYVLVNLPFEELSISVDDTLVSQDYPYDWNTRIFSEGPHEITVTGRRLGESFSDTALVFVDNLRDRVSPPVSIFQPFPGERLDGERAVRAVFEELPDHVYVVIDGRLVSNALPYIWDTSLAEGGAHEIRVYAVDGQGNIGFDSVSVAKVVDDDPDGDGWSNELEKLYRSDPSNPDTDGDGLIDSVDPDPLRDYTSIYQYFYILLILFLITIFVLTYVDLRLLLIVTLAAAVLIVVKPFNTSPLRIPFALFLVFFSTGYAFISALFPRGDDLSHIERFTLSVAFSIALFVFNGFALNYTWGFRTLPIVVTVSAITLGFAAAAAYLRARVPAGERFNVSLRLPRYEKTPVSDIERALIIALVLSIFISGAMLVYAKLTFKHEEFSALYILGPGGKAEGYNKGLYLGRPLNITVGVENYERRPVSYRLEVRLAGELMHNDSFSLEHEGKWLQDISFTPSVVSDRARLEFLLYKDGGSEVYRSVHLWVTSQPNYADPSSFDPYLIGVAPVVENYDFELVGSGWGFTSTHENITGWFDNSSYVSPPFSYAIGFRSGAGTAADDFGELSQTIYSDEAGLAVLSFSLLDSFRGAQDDRYIVQALVNGRVLWTGNVAGNRGWERFIVPVVLEKGENGLEFRLVQKTQNGMLITLWLDDVKLELAESLVVL